MTAASGAAAPAKKAAGAKRAAKSAQSTTAAKATQAKAAAARGTHYTQNPSGRAVRRTLTGKSTGRTGNASPNIDPHAVLLHPIVTEKTMMLMDANNSLEFLVRRTADRTQVKAAVEKLFDCKVDHVNTRITKDGKRAIVKFGGETTAEDIGMRIGVF